MNILNTKCTFYKSVKEHHFKGGPLVTPGKIVKIIDLLTNERYTNTNLLNQLRISGYKSEFYETNKSGLSAACFSSVQDNLTIDRSDANHLFHTGFITFDIDTKQNPNLLIDGESMRDYIIDNIPYVSYLGKSVSNLGYWGLFPILNRDDHYGHYEAMKQLFLNHKIIIDRIQDLSRLRFLSYDPDGYLNEDAKLFTNSIITENTMSIDEYERKPTEELFRGAYNWVGLKYDIKFEKGSIHNYLLYFYSTLRACHISRPEILKWVFANLINEELVTTNCLDEPKWKK